MVPRRTGKDEWWLLRSAAWWFALICVLALFFVDIWVLAIGNSCFTQVLWLALIAGLQLVAPLVILVVAVRQLCSVKSVRGHLSRFLLSLLLLVAGNVLSVHALFLGNCFYVWRQEAQLLDAVRTLIASPPPEGYDDVSVDRRDSPPVRAAIYYWEAHGDLTGILYDPTGGDQAKVRGWISNAWTMHLYGPWYRISN